MEITRKQLIKTAKEMNEVMGLEDPALDTTLPDPKLKAQIIKAIELINPDEDEFSEETTAVIEALGGGAAPAEDAEEPAADAEAGEEADVPLPQLVANTRKLSELKELVNAKDEFKKIRKDLDKYQGLGGPKELQTAMFKILGVEPPKPAPKAAAAAKEKKIPRVACVGKTLVEKKSLTIDEWVKASDELYASNGNGKANERESRACVNYALLAFSSAGFIKVEGENVKLTVKTT